MALESLPPGNHTTWILSLLPPRLPGEVKRTFAMNNGSQGIIISPLINLPLETGELVESFFAVEHGSQIKKGDFVSFQWDKPGQRGYNKTKEEYGDPRAISISFISTVEAIDIANGFREVIAEDLRRQLLEREKEIDKKQKEIDSIIEEKLSSRHREIDAVEKKLQEKEVELQLIEEELTSNFAEKEAKLAEDWKRQEKLFDQKKQELKSLSDSIDRLRQDAEKIRQEITPYRLAVPQQSDSLIDQGLTDSTIPKDLIKYWQAALLSQGLNLPKTLAVSYILSLISAFYSGSLVLLNGPVGVGKTSIVKASSHLLGGTSKVIPVRPAWLDPTDLLGFFDPIKEVFRPTPFLNALKDARNSPESLSLICLDELNLARIENYGADLLSVLEYSRLTDIEKDELKTQQGILLYSESIETELWQEAKLLNEKTSKSDKEQQRLEQLQMMLRSYKSNFLLPSNVVIIGTLNSDETTYDLSPKVIDRAYVINYPFASLASMSKLSNIPPLDIADNTYLLVSVLNREIDLLLRQISQPELAKHSDIKDFVESLKIGWEKVLQWNKSFSDLGIPLGHRANRDFRIVYAVGHLLGLSSQDCLGHFLFTKLLPRVSFFKSSTTSDQYDQWLNLLRKDFKDLGSNLNQYDPGDVLSQIQRQVEDTRRQHVRYWVRV